MCLFTSLFSLIHTGNTALHVAVEAGDTDTVFTLLEEGADCTIRNHAGKLARDLTQKRAIQHLLDRIGNKG